MTSSAIFIFHRDLRKEDNIGLIQTAKTHDIIYPIFIFTPEQVTDNPYKSDNSVEFMCNSLSELDDFITLFYGDTISILKRLVKKIKPTTIAFNRDYTPYALKRDNKIRITFEPNINVISYDDICLNPPEATLKSDKTPYKKFTPFYNHCKTLEVLPPIKYNITNSKKIKTVSINLEKFYKSNKNILVRGGRKEGLRLLKPIPNYNETRDIPSIPTTHLSAHLKFGTISPREAYAVFNTDLRRQLYWRDFYMMIIFYYPNLYGSYTQTKYNDLSWKNDHVKEWKMGKTGFPIVDAAMTQLNTTGYMHNRCRMIVATFLIYNLHVNWKKGEKYFSKRLVDCDISNNLGNWKWVAGIESYSNDYFKAMSIVNQAKRFDPDAVYIRQWLPQLKNISTKALLDPEKYKIPNYPEPIVNSSETRKQWIAKMKSA